ARQRQRTISEVEDGLKSSVQVFKRVRGEARNNESECNPREAPPLFGGGSQILPTLTLMRRWTKTTMRSNMSPVLERSGECPACRSASIYSRAISPPAFR